MADSATSAAPAPEADHGHHHDGDHHHFPAWLNNPFLRWLAGIWKSWCKLFKFAGPAAPYWGVFGALMVGTFLTVLVYWADVNLGKKGVPILAEFFDDQVGPTDLVIGLFIATAKATFVLAFFMHMLHERRLIFRVMGVTFFFFLALLLLCFWAIADKPGAGVDLRMETHNPYAVHAKKGHGGDHGKEHGGDEHH